jgi:hypothetical protein
MARTATRAMISPYSTSPCAPMRASMGLIQHVNLL